MARIARREILGDGEYYHIVVRGNGKKSIFSYKCNYRLFINLANHYLSKFPLHIYHYCLMKNHIHLLVQLINAWSLPKFMQGVLQTYAAYYRNRYDCPGYLFQNRYQSYWINKESYLLSCARYIERNPLEAGIVENLSDYEWSSFNYYVKGLADPLIKKPSPFYLELGSTPQERQKNYKVYIFENETSEPTEK